MTKANLARLETLYNGFYSALYIDLITTPDASNYFDYYMEHNPRFAAAVTEFGDHRKDRITSDREAAAFYLAYYALVEAV